jgi:hypothetical protein
VTTSDHIPADPRDPGEAFLQDEIDQNRAGEWILLPKAAIAFAFVGALVALHQIFFA